MSRFSKGNGGATVKAPVRAKTRVGGGRNRGVCIVRQLRPPGWNASSVWIAPAEADRSRGDAVLGFHGGRRSRDGSVACQATLSDRSRCLNARRRKGWRGTGCLRLEIRGFYQPRFRVVIITAFSKNRTEKTPLQGCLKRFFTLPVRSNHIRAMKHRIEQFPVGQRLTPSGHFAQPVVLEAARPVGEGYECHVRLPDGTHNETILSADEALLLFGQPLKPRYVGQPVEPEKLRLLTRSAVDSANRRAQRQTRRPENPRYVR